MDAIRHYLEIMKNLGVTSKNTIILEDLNPGITSALASGVYTIVFTQNLLKGYKQIPADVRADNMQEVITLIKQRMGYQP